MLAGLFAAAVGAGEAQALQRLTVDSFDLSADAASPKVDVPFHLLVRLRVRQHVTQIENLNLPMLAQVELLGDDRETLGSSRGTEYRETITVVAHVAGPIAIAPATLQAIDARDGKAKQWYTNGLTLRVAANGSAAAAASLQLALRVLLLILGIAAVLAVVTVIVLFARRPRAIAPPPAVVEAEPEIAPPVVRTQWDVARDALAVLRAERTRAAAVTVRGSIWRMVGASEGETLGDVLRRPDSSDPPMRSLLVALERSAFTYDEDLRAAIDDAGSALERFIETAPR